MGDEYGDDFEIEESDTSDTSTSDSISDTEISDSSDFSEPDTADISDDISEISEDIEDSSETDVSDIPDEITEDTGDLTEEASESSEIDETDEVLEDIPEDTESDSAYESTDDDLSEDITDDVSEDVAEAETETAEESSDVPDEITEDTGDVNEEDDSQSEIPDELDEDIEEDAEAADSDSGVTTETADNADVTTDAETPDDSEALVDTEAVDETDVTDEAEAADETDVTDETEAVDKSDVTDETEAADETDTTSETDGETESDAVADTNQEETDNSDDSLTDNQADSEDDSQDEEHQKVLAKRLGSELDLLRSGNDAIEQRLEVQRDQYADEGLSDEEINDRISADRWNFQKEFLNEAFPGQDVSPNVFNGFKENGAMDRIKEIEDSPSLRAAIDGSDVNSADIETDEIETETDTDAADFEMDEVEAQSDTEDIESDELEAVEDSADTETDAADNQADEASMEFGDTSDFSPEMNDELDRLMLDDVNEDPELSDAEKEKCIEVIDSVNAPESSDISTVDETVEGSDDSTDVSKDATDINSSSDATEPVSDKSPVERMNELLTNDVLKADKTGYQVAMNAISQDLGKHMEDLDAKITDAASKRQESTDLLNTYINTVSEDMRDPELVSKCQEDIKRFFDEEQSLKKEKETAGIYKEDADNAVSDEFKDTQFVSANGKGFSDTYNDFINEQGVTYSDVINDCGVCTMANLSNAEGGRDTEASALQKGKGSFAYVTIPEDATEDEIKYALNLNGRTSLESQLEILDKLGCEGKGYSNGASFDDIVSNLEAGHPMSLNLYGKDLSSGEKIAPRPFLTGRKLPADHAVTIAGIAKDKEGEALGLFVNDTGGYAGKDHPQIFISKDKYNKILKRTSNISSVVNMGRR